MFRSSLALFFIFFVSQCSTDRWRANTVENISNGKSQVFAVDSFSFGKAIKVEKYRLTNGLKVIIMEDHSAPVFAYHTWFNVGSRNEREGITGIAHLFEHLMFKETKNLKDGEFDRILEEQGGRINASTYTDWTFYRESLPKEAFHLIPKLEADRMQNMILNDAQVNAEREVVANERRFRTDNSPSGTMFELLNKTAFTKHPYHWPVIGWMKDIQSITTKDCIDFHHTYYAPNNATVVVVGDIDTETALREINEAYGAIPSSMIPPDALPVEPPQEKERREAIDQPIPADKLVIGYKIGNSLHPDAPVLEVANALLFEGKSSRLYRKLVTDKEIAAETGGWVDQAKDPSLYVIDVTMREGRTAAEAEKNIDEELTRLQTTDVPNDELEKVKNRLETSFWENFRNVDQKAQALGYHETVVKDYRRYFQDVDKYQKVSAADVRRVANTYFQTNHRTVIVAHPSKKTS